MARLRAFAVAFAGLVLSHTFHKISLRPPPRIQFDYGQSFPFIAVPRDAGLWRSLGIPPESGWRAWAILFMAAPMAAVVQSNSLRPELFAVYASASVALLLSEDKSHYNNHDFLFMFIAAALACCQPVECELSPGPPVKARLRAGLGLFSVVWLAMGSARTAGVSGFVAPVGVVPLWLYAAAGSCSPDDDESPRWNLQLLRAIFVAIYVLAGLAKCSSDWLSGATGELLLQVWDERRRQCLMRDDAVGHSCVLYNLLPVAKIDASLATRRGIIDVGQMFGVSSMLIDLVFGPMLLLGSPYRIVAITVLVPFHLINHFLFRIGVFPSVMLSAFSLFFEPAPAPAPTGMDKSRMTWTISSCATVRASCGFLVFSACVLPGLFCAGHELFWRKALTDSDLLFDGGACQYFTCRMMTRGVEPLHDVRIVALGSSSVAELDLKGHIPGSVQSSESQWLHPARQFIDPRRHLDARQLRHMAASPEALVQYVQGLLPHLDETVEDGYQEAGSNNGDKRLKSWQECDAKDDGAVCARRADTKNASPWISAESWVAINGPPFQRFFNPSKNLAMASMANVDQWTRRRITKYRSKHWRAAMKSMRESFGQTTDASDASLATRTIFLADEAIEAGYHGSIVQQVRTTPATDDNGGGGAFCRLHVLDGAIELEVDGGDDDDDGDSETTTTTTHRVAANSSYVLPETVFEMRLARGEATAPWAYELVSGATLSL